MVALHAASALGVKELLPPYLKKDLSLEELKTGVSFASAGSGYDNSTCRTMVTHAFSFFLRNTAQTQTQSCTNTRAHVTDLHNDTH